MRGDPHGKDSDNYVLFLTILIYHNISGHSLIWDLILWLSSPLRKFKKFKKKTSKKK